MFYEGCTAEEIEAYRDLESATFDFGEGNMKIEGWYGSEDAYYEMDIQNHYENQLDDYISNNFTSEEDINFNRLSWRNNQHYKMMIDKSKLDRLYDIGSWWTVADRGKYKIRHYVSARAKHYKKISNKSIRKYKGVIPKGNQYRKLYEYWWNIW